jgi:hypothetical protein
MCHALSFSASSSNNAEVRALYAIWSHFGFAGVDLFFVISGAWHSCCQLGRATIGICLFLIA